MSFDQAHADTLRELAAERALADDLAAVLDHAQPASRRTVLLERAEVDRVLARYREERQR